MWKEIIISIVIVLMVIIGNNVTQGYIVDSAEEMCNRLNELKAEINKEENNIKEDDVYEKLKNIEDCWDERHERLAYFIEHDELEKVENNIATMKSFVETKEYPDSISNIDENIFILNHIEEKYAFSLENIF